MKRPAAHLLLLPVSLLVASCGSMETIKSTASSSMNKMGEGFGKAADLATSPFRPGVPVVEAREDDLRQIPTGQDQAIAFQQAQSEKNFWNFFGSVDFEEPSLPDDGSDMDTSLLPPIE